MMAQATSAVAARRSRSANARQRWASIPSVPLRSARPSLASSTTGSSPAAASASAPNRRRPAASTTSPAGSAEAPELGDDRREAGREQGGQPVDEHRPGAGEAGGQRPGPEQHHGPDDLGLDEIAHAGGVAEHQRQLQAPGLGRRDLHRRQRPEPGGDAVDRGPLGHDPLHHRPGRRHPGGRLRGDRHGGAVAGHRHHVGHGERRPVEGHDRPAGRVGRRGHPAPASPVPRPVSRSSARTPRPATPRRWRRRRPSPGHSARRARCGATTAAAASGTG